jgi:hypothetical protein
MTLKAMNEARASEIAITALGHIASDDEEMGRFLALTGLSAGELRQAAANPGFLMGVLDFYMGHEPSLLKFAEASAIEPQEIVDARQFLAGPEEAW